MRRAIPADLLRLLQRQGAAVVGEREIQDATQYVLARGPERATLNVYSTGRVLEGGKASALRDLLRDWRTSRPGAPAGRKRAGSPLPVPGSTPRVGTDEAGKGDYLGPLVVAGVRVLGAEEDRRLRGLGVRDSKLLGMDQVRRLAAGIEAEIGHRDLRVVALPPREYEARREAAGGNVNRLLAELNAGIIRELEADVEVAVVDAFGQKAEEYLRPRMPEGVRLEVRPRAEDDAAVAAASILARARYLEEMDRLSELVGFELPRGSTHVLEAARRVYEERGMEGLREVAKVHFATTERVVSTAQRSGEGADDG